MKRKLTALFLMLFLFTFSTAVSAEKTDAMGVLQSGTAAQSGQVDLTLSLTQNPGVVALYVDIFFDTKAFTLTSVTDGALLEGFLQGTGTDSAVRLSWQQTDTLKDNTATGLLATLHFTVVNEAATGDYPITVTPVTGSVVNSNLEDVALQIPAGKVTVTCSHTYVWKVIKEAQVGVPGEEAYVCTRCGDVAQIRAIPALTGPASITSDTFAVNQTDKTISKVEAGTTVAQLLAGLNEKQSIKIFSGDAQVTDGTLVGTGMTVTLYEGTAVKATYTVVVTGDVSGDGKINITDMMAIKAHILDKIPLTGVALLAGDVSGDHKPNITDFISVKSYILGKSSISALAV